MRYSPASVVGNMPGSSEAGITFSPASSIAAMEARRHGRHERRDVVEITVNGTCSSRTRATTSSSCSTK